MRNLYVESRMGRAAPGRMKMRGSGPAALHRGGAEGAEKARRNTKMRLSQREGYYLGDILASSARGHRDHYGVYALAPRALN